MLKCTAAAAAARATAAPLPWHYSLLFAILGHYLQMLAKNKLTKVYHIEGCIPMKRLRAAVMAGGKMKARRAPMLCSSSATPLTSAAAV